MDKLGQTYIFVMQRLLMLTRRYWRLIIVLLTVAPLRPEPKLSCEFWGCSYVQREQAWIQSESSWDSGAKLDCRLKANIAWQILRSSYVRISVCEDVGMLVLKTFMPLDTIVLLWNLLYCGHCTFTYIYIYVISDHFLGNKSYYAGGMILFVSIRSIWSSR